MNLKSLIYLFTFVYILGGVYLYFFQRSFIYYPTKKVEHTALIESYKIDSEDIKVIVLNPNQKDAILYFGGRSEAVANNIKNFENSFPKYTIYLVNYRGYGTSSGTPTEKNLYNDATFIYNKIAKRHSTISVIGRSLGTGVATYVASTSKVEKLVLVTPYDSILNMAKDKYPFYPISYILEDQYNSIQRVKNIAAPTLIFLASSDETIDARYSDNLIKEFDPLTLSVKTIQNSGHKTIVEKQEYFTQMQNFLK